MPCRFRNEQNPIRLFTDERRKRRGGLFQLRIDRERRKRAAIVVDRLETFRGLLGRQWNSNSGIEGEFLCQSGGCQIQRFRWKRGAVDMPRALVVPFVGLPKKRLGSGVNSV